MPVTFVVATQPQPDKTQPPKAVLQAIQGAGTTFYPTGRSADTCGRALLIVLVHLKLWLLEGQAAEQFAFRGEENVLTIQQMAQFLKNAANRKHWGQKVLVDGTDGRQYPIASVFKIQNRIDQPADVVVQKLNPNAMLITLDHQPQTTIAELSHVLRCLVATGSPQKDPVFRDYLDYRVEFSDAPPACRLAQRLRSEHYSYYQIRLQFDRIVKPDESSFSVGLVTSVEHLQEFMRWGDLIYREVYSLHQDDRDWFEQECRAIRNIPAVDERAQRMYQLFDIRAFVNDGEVRPTELITRTHGICFCYPLPTACKSREKMRFRFEAVGLQQRSQYNFPFVFSEPTRSARFVFDYRQARIENVNYFVGCRITPDNKRIEIEHNPESRCLSATRNDGTLLYPGEAVLVQWTPITKAARIELVNLADFDARWIVASPYATTENFLNRRLYPSDRLYLVRETAEKLRRVQDQLAKRQLRLLIWDAYRPVSVQRQMWTLKPDPRYVADPTKGSVHNRGCAVDVSLADWNGKPLDMPTDFDHFGEEAHRDRIDAAQPPADENARLLQTEMTACGFVGFPTEWWHFDDANAARYPVLELPDPM